MLNSYSFSDAKGWLDFVTFANPSEDAAKENAPVWLYPQTWAASRLAYTAQQNVQSQLGRHIQPSTDCYHSALSDRYFALTLMLLLDGTCLGLRFQAKIYTFKGKP